MKSPICEACGKDFRSEMFHVGRGGVCLDFADYVPLPPGAGGHPFGSGWFCNEHSEDARSMLHLNFGDAISRIRERYAISESDLPAQYGPVKNPELWVIDVGDNINEVFSSIRQAMNISPREAKELLSSGIFKVISGWPSELRSCQLKLDSVGATTEIRYVT